MMQIEIESNSQNIRNQPNTQWRRLRAYNYRAVFCLTYALRTGSVYLTFTLPRVPSFSVRILVSDVSTVAVETIEILLKPHLQIQSVVKPLVQPV